MGPAQPSELDVICSIIRPKRDHDEIANALRAPIDWGALLNFAAAHRIRPQLIRALQELQWMGVPSETKRSLLNFLPLHKARSLFLVSELIRVCGHLSQKGIRIATFKGPSLAAALYGDLSLRECGDIDIIVDEQQVVRTEATLNSLGYRAEHGSSNFRRAFLAYQRQFMLVREAPRLVIDLHWDFTSSYAPFPISPTEIWDSVEQVSIGDRLIPTLGRNELVLFLAGHGTKEGWRRLGWVSDFARLIERHPDLDWDLLLDRARRRGCGRSLLLGCQLASRLLDARVRRDLLTEPTAQAFAQRALHRLRNAYPAAPTLESDLGDLELCENSFQRARAIGKFLITRTVGDYVSMPLPSSLWRVYHLTRPFRLSGKVAKKFGLISPRQRRSKGLA